MDEDPTLAIDDGAKKYPQPWGYLQDPGQRRWWFRARVHVTGGPVIAFAGKNVDNELILLFFCHIQGAIGPTPYILHSQRGFDSFLFPTKVDDLKKKMDNRWLVRSSPASLEKEARYRLTSPNLSEEDWINKLWQLVFEKGNKDLYSLLQYPTSIPQDEKKKKGSTFPIVASNIPATRASLDYSRFANIDDSDDDDHF